MSDNTDAILKQNFQAENSKNVNVKFSHCSDDFFPILQRGEVKYFYFVRHKWLILDIDLFQESLDLLRQWLVDRKCQGVVVFFKFKNEFKVCQVWKDGLSRRRDQMFG